MSDTNDYQMAVQTEDGPVTVSVSRAALAKLAGRSHVTTDEVAQAHRMEIEDIVRDKRLGSARMSVRIDEQDL